MVAKKKRNAQTQINALTEYLDISEWLGRFPSPKSPFSYESRKAFWMNRMRSARKGNRHCKWYPEIEAYADERGYPNLFTTDLRVMWRRHFKFDNQTIVIPVKDIQFSEFPFKHIQVREEDGEPCFFIRVMHQADWKAAPGDQLVWACTDGADICPFRAYQIFSGFEEFRSGEGYIPMADQTFGKWKVLGFAERAGYNSEFLWFCLCECGSFRKIAGSRLRKGLSQSCGCSRVTSVIEERAEISAT